MNKILLITATTLLMGTASCHNKREAINLNGEWKVSSIDGKIVPETLEEVKLSFDNTSNSYYGMTGVNIINGTYLLDKQSLILEEGAMTRKMGDPVSNEVEIKYINAIHAVKSVADKNGSLLLQDENGKTLMVLDRR